MQLYTCKFVKLYKNNVKSLKWWCISVCIASIDFNWLHYCALYKVHAYTLYLMPMANACETYTIQTSHWSSFCYSCNLFIHVTLLYAFVLCVSLTVLIVNRKLSQLSNFTFLTILRSIQYTCMYIYCTWTYYSVQASAKSW